MTNQRSVKIELINTGSELLLGRRLNTHAQWLALRLARLGLPLTLQTAVDDAGPAIRQAVARALLDADLIITTGGLGPTSDDRTRELIAELAGRPLREDAQVLAHIERMFKERLRRPAPVSTAKQALVPAGAAVLMNQQGTAPGLVLDLVSPQGAPRLLVMLPGPARELCPMFDTQVVPILQARFPQEPCVSHLFRTTGLGESLVEEKIHEPLSHWMNRGMEIAYCAHPGDVEVRLSLRGPEAEAGIAAAAATVRSLLGELIYTEGEEGLEEVVVRRLTERKLTLALAESCTGGLLAHRLTNVPGASEVFLAGLVTYSNSAKQTLLGVETATLESHGAVSEETALQMVAGVRRRFGSDFAVSITGIAGPGGGTEEKPVGTVYIGISTPLQTTARRFLNPYDRETFKWVTTQQALDLVRVGLAAGG